MTKFEYGVKTYRTKIDYGDDYEVKQQQLVDWMNAFGIEGWELVHYGPFVTSTEEGVITVWKRAHAPA